jgi:hypothetical protein
MLQQGLLYNLVLLDLGSWKKSRYIQEVGVRSIAKEIHGLLNFAAAAELYFAWSPPHI